MTVHSIRNISIYEFWIINIKLDNIIYFLSHIIINLFLPLLSRIMNEKYYVPCRLIKGSFRDDR